MIGTVAWDDIGVGRALHRRHGSTYFYASRLFPPPLRDRIDAVYGFVRTVDEWVDNPSSDGPPPQARIHAVRDELARAWTGARTESAPVRALASAARAVGMPIDEPLRFVDAMEQDLRVNRYHDRPALEAYMRGSAGAVGLMICDMAEAPLTPAMRTAACELGAAMQLTNFLRDIGEDYARGRIYLPQSELREFGVTESDIAGGRVTDAFRDLMRSEIAAARARYAAADSAIPDLPVHAQTPIRLARHLYARILNRIEAQDYDVFGQRARIGWPERLVVTSCILCGGVPRR